MWLFYYFDFERNHNVLNKVKESQLFVEKNINFNKNETETKMENFRTFRETIVIRISFDYGEINFVLELI